MGRGSQWDHRGPRMLCGGHRWPGPDTEMAGEFKWVWVTLRSDKSSLRVTRMAWLCSSPPGLWGSTLRVFRVPSGLSQTPGQADPRAPPTQAPRPHARPARGRGWGTNARGAGGGQRRLPLLSRWGLKHVLGGVKTLSPSALPPSEARTPCAPSSRTPGPKPSDPS